MFSFHCLRGLGVCSKATLHPEQFSVIPGTICNVESCNNRPASVRHRKLKTVQDIGKLSKLSRLNGDLLCKDPLCLSDGEVMPFDLPSPGYFLSVELWSRHMKEPQSDIAIVAHDMLLHAIKGAHHQYRMSTTPVLKKMKRCGQQLKLCGDPKCLRSAPYVGP